MTAIANIREYLQTIPTGEPFATKNLSHLATAENLRQALNRLTKAGELKRIARGIFARLSVSQNNFTIPPSISEVTKIVIETSGETISIHGAEAARQLQLTTQVPLQPVFYTTGNTRRIKIGNRTVLLKHISPSKLVAPGTIAGTVITALLYLGRKQVTVETIKKISAVITEQEFADVLQYMSKMPAWLADIFYRYRRNQIHG